ncbi:MAG: cytidylyltransferase domain-containing protein [Halanaerobiales bacterium]
MKDKILAIIPARSGSKGLKDKNIKNLHGKPLIAYTIEVAIASGIFETIIVTTDSKEYADIAIQYGAEVPFLRSEELSSDTTSSKEVIIDAISKMNCRGYYYDYFMLLQPTSPLRTVENIKESYDLLVKRKANSVVSVCKVDHSPLLSNILDETLLLDNFLKKFNNKRRQDLPQYYRINGAIYLSKVDYYLKFQDFYKRNSIAYIMNKKESVDVDDIYDFKLAEILIKENIM